MEVKWTNREELAFHVLKKAINECPKLFFVREEEEHTILLNTDASEFGIGAYCCQMVEGVEHPIAFVSKELTDVEMKWNVTEKECYAIVYALRKLEYLLKDRSFVLSTDHKNLVYMNEPPSAKVRSWKLAIQEFDFKIQHVLLKSEEEEKGCTITKAKVRTFIKQCVCCQKMSFLKQPIITHPFTLTTYNPWERIYIDALSVGSPEKEGFMHLLALIDGFSRWVELFPLKTLEAKETAERLLEHFGRFGQPDELVTDNGKEFLNQVIHNYMNLAGIDHINTTPHSHEENGMVERENREILKHLRNAVFDKRLGREWRSAVPFAQRYINSEKKEQQVLHWLQ